MSQPPTSPTWQKRLAFFGILATAGCLVTLLTVYKLSVANAYRIFAVQATPIAMPQDANAIARGVHLTTDVLACRSCHGADFGGRVLQDDALAVVSAPNLTTGRTDAQWLRALRFGIDDEGRGLWRMPTRAHSALTDADLAAVVAAVRAAPPIVHSLPQSQLHWRGNVAVACRQLVLLGTDASRLQPTFTAEAEPGAYLWAQANCAACHTNVGTAAESFGPEALTDADSFSRALVAGHRGLPADGAQAAVAMRRASRKWRCGRCGATFSKGKARRMASD
jgi:mono/diheme cytochrome c family protein